VRKSRFNEEQIIAILKEAEGRVAHTIAFILLSRVPRPSFAWAGVFLRLNAFVWWEDSALRFLKGGRSSLPQSPVGSWSRYLGALSPSPQFRSALYH